MLKSVAQRLQSIVDDTICGGWSSEQVHDQKATITDIFAFIGRGGNVFDVTKLKEVAHKLDNWVKAKQTGGWSTQSVESMFDLAQGIYAFIGSHHRGW